MSDYEKVLEFTKGAKQNVTDEPTPMNAEETFFLIRMLLSEIQELALTSPDVSCTSEGIELVREALKSIDTSEYELLDTPDKRCAAQADAVVDMWYYMLIYNLYIFLSYNIAFVFFCNFCRFVCIVRSYRLIWDC